MGANLLNSLRRVHFLQRKDVSIGPLHLLRNSANLVQVYKAEQLFIIRQKAFQAELLVGWCLGSLPVIKLFCLSFRCFRFQLTMRMYRASSSSPCLVSKFCRSTGGCSKPATSSSISDLSGQAHLGKNGSSSEVACNLAKQLWLKQLLAMLEVATVRVQA